MITIPIKPELIRWALERSGLEKRTLLRRFPKIELWERAEQKPTLKQLEDFAKATFTPLGYFFLPSPPEDKLPIPDFRTVKDAPVRRPSPNLLETVQMMQRRYTWMRDFLMEQGEKPLAFIASARLSDNPETIAGKIKKVLGLNKDWARQQPRWTDALHELRIAIEKVGVLTVFNGVIGNNTRRPLDVDEFRGFVLCDQYAPLIFVNAADAKAAQMFTLVHELAHLWLGRDGVFNLEALQPTDNDVEKFCNRVAAEFLIPAQEIASYWPEVKKLEEPFQELAHRFKVSPLVAARRALDLEFISKHAFFKFYEEYLADERRKFAKGSSGGDFYATQDVRIGRRFAEAVIRATREGRLLYRDAYQLTGLHGQTFDRYAKMLGVRL